jgi:hypothetical protein
MFRAGFAVRAAGGVAAIERRVLAVAILRRPRIAVAEAPEGAEQWRG